MIQFPKSVYLSLLYMSLFFLCLDGGQVENG